MFFEGPVCGDDHGGGGVAGVLWCCGGSLLTGGGDGRRASHTDRWKLVWLQGARAKQGASERASKVGSKREWERERKRSRDNASLHDQTLLRGWALVVFFFSIEDEKSFSLLYTLPAVRGSGTRSPVGFNRSWESKEKYRVWASALDEWRRHISYYYVCSPGAPGWSKAISWSKLIQKEMTPWEFRRYGQLMI